MGRVGDPEQLRGDTRGARIKAAWKYSGWNQDDLAKEIKVSATALRAWFTKSKPEEENLQAFCGLTGVSIDWIKTGVGDPLRPHSPEDAVAWEALVEYLARTKVEPAEVKKLQESRRLLGPNVTVEAWAKLHRLLRETGAIEASTEDPRKGDLGGFMPADDD